MRSILMIPLRKRVRSIGLALGVLAGLGAMLTTSAAQQRPEDAGNLHVVEVQGFRGADQLLRGADPVVDNETRVHMIAGAGGNVAVQIGREGVLIVDTGRAADTDALLAAVRRLTDKPIRHIVNSQAGADHTGGNERVSRAGERLGGTALQGFGAQIYAYNGVLARLSGVTEPGTAVPFAMWPTDTFLTSRMDFSFNDEAVEIVHTPAAHSDADSFVFFRRSDVVATGDLFVKTSFPVIRLDQGGTINGLLNALNRLLEIAVPREKQDNGTMLIPGHGRLSDEADLAEYRDMVTIIRDRIQNMAAKGMTLAQVQAARPTLDYDPYYGSVPEWTSAMFVEAVYRSLPPAPAAPTPARRR